MDVKMPPTYSMEGIEAAHLLKRERPDLGVVVLSQHDDEEYVWALLEGGVEGYGYLHKVRVGEVDQLVRAIREVAAGGSVLDPRIVVHHYGFRSNAEWPVTVGSYGVGVGAFYFKHVRAGDAYAAALLARLLVIGTIRTLKRIVLAQPSVHYRTYLGHLVVGMWRSRAYRVDRRKRLYRSPAATSIRAPPPAG